VFPPGRFSVKMKKLRVSKRYGKCAPVFMAAVIQYLVGEITQLAGFACLMNRKRRITPKHLQIAFTGDEELLKLVANTLFAGMKMPRIQEQLFSGKAEY
jgi:histone H2A